MGNEALLGRRAWIIDWQDNQTDFLLLQYLEMHFYWALVGGSFS